MFPLGNHITSLLSLSRKLLAFADTGNNIKTYSGLGNKFDSLVLCFVWVFFAKVGDMSRRDVLVVQSLQSKTVCVDITIRGDYSQYLVYI